VKRALVGVAVVCLTAAPAARADADPASDVLISRNVFYPYNAKIADDVVERLETVLRDAQERRFRIKVALIAQRYDLGGVFQLYRQPQRYAEFLGQELVFVYGGRLLVAMPNGFGYADRGKPQARLARALTGLQAPGTDPTRLAEAATTAVRRLAAAGGHRLPPPKPSSGGSETRDRILIAAGAAVALALAAGVVVARRVWAKRASPR
jgi:hypothetical protein